ncbi:pyruvate kinase [Aureococcus anophagefferens]|nr:pyruvate kinase [Aureococcus anophagefferens]
MMRILAVAACASALLAPRPHLRPPSAVRVIETAPTTTAPVALPGAPERWKKATKQLATLGPASSTLAMLEKLFLAGVDVFRLNFSHGAHEEKAELVKLIRQVEAKYGHPIAILADLQGPKLRVGVFGQDKVLLSAGQKFRFDLDDEPGDAGASVVLPISPLTPKDRADLAFALTQSIDWVALSFVQQPKDVAELRQLVKASAPGVSIMAKLEKPAAVADGSLEAIVDLCDGIMVARGDLGVEMNPEDVPIIQKKIIKCCRDRGTPVVVATQMLESMIDAPTPTRAECCDIATAIYDGADAVMLSAESAAGLYPEAVAMQRRVISRRGRRVVPRNDADVAAPEKTATDAITAAARSVALTIGAKCMVVFTSLARRCASGQGRPPVPILALTPSEDTARALALTWGVYSRVDDYFGEDVEFNDVLKKAVGTAKDVGFLDDDLDVAVVTAGLPWGTPGASNVLRVVPAAGPDNWPDVLCYPETED